MLKQQFKPSKSSKLFYGWVIVSTCFLIQVVGWGIHNSFGVFFASFQADFAWNRALIAGAASISFLICGISGIFMGGLNDRFGPRRIMTFSGVLLGVGYLLMAHVQSVWELYLYYGLIIGIGISGTDIVLLSTAARWFVRRRGAVTGLIKVGTGLGMVIMPIFLKVLITNWGWRTCFTVLGVLILITYLLLARLLVRDPGQKGLLPDNCPVSDPLCRPHPDGGLRLRRALETRALWTLCGICFFALFTLYTIMLHIVSHAIDSGFSVGSAASILSTIGGVSIAGRLVMGWAGDRLGSGRALIICFGMILAGLVLLQLTASLSLLYGFAIIHGFAHGGFFSMMSPTVANLFGMRAHGAILGVIIFSGAIGGTIGPILAGYIFDVTLSYRTLFMILTGATFLALLLAMSLPLRPMPNRSQGH